MELGSLQTLGDLSVQMVCILDELKSWNEKYAKCEKCGQINCVCLHNVLRTAPSKQKYWKFKKILKWVRRKTQKILRKVQIWYHNLRLNWSLESYKKHSNKYLIYTKRIK